MFCGNCGSEMKEGARFCPNCGKKAGVNDGGQARTVDVEMTEEPQAQKIDMESAQAVWEKVNVPKLKKSRRKIWIPIILVLSLVAGFFGFQQTVKNRIISETDQYLSIVKNGVDNQTAEQILATAVPQLVGNETISNFILSNVSGEDAMDVYLSMMRYMDYEITDVTMVKLNHYQTTVRIQNLNNGLVAKHAFKVFKGRYDTSFLGKISQGWEDLTSDKSQLIAEMMEQAADDYSQYGDGSCWIEGEYTIDIVYENGELKISLDKMALALSCLGVN